MTYLLVKNYSQSKMHFSNCYQVAAKVKNRKLQLDCLLCLAYISYV